MEFSNNYSRLMEDLATRSESGQLMTSNSARQSLAYSTMLKFDLEKVCEIPVTAFNTAAYNLGVNGNEGVRATLVYPLFVGPYFKQCTGAETMLKYFSREYRGRINKATTPKGETYYGNNGIILDANLDPLMVATIKIEQNGTTNPERLQYVIHLHPHVFTDDSKILNKSLAKKGIGFYLSSSIYDWVRQVEIPYKIEIDDCSKFVVKAHRPDIQHCDDRDFNNVLKQNIDEVLNQIKHDYRRYI